MKRFVATCLASMLTFCGSVIPVCADDETPTNQFPLQLYVEVAKEHPTANVLVSPFSVYTALSMTFNGAAGDTKREIGKALGFAEFGSVEEIAARAKLVLDSLRTPGSKTRLDIANALFGEKSITFKPEFISVNKQYFDAEISSLDFKSPESLTTINNWVSEKTQGKIPTIIDQIGADAILYLINAIYFKGTWAHKFDKAATKPADFTLSDESVKKVPMMRLSRSDMQYFGAGDFQVISLPYSDGRLSLYIILPGKQSSLAAFEGTLTKARWDDIIGRLEKRDGTLLMPRFKVQDKMTLKEILSKMGLAKAFSDQADFSDMAAIEQKIFISQVFHKTFMEVNEEGTEAAAATAVEMSTTSAMADPPPPFEMNVNRPFVLALRDNKTDSLLFMGHIADPAAE